MQRNTTSLARSPYKLRAIITLAVLTLTASASLANNQGPRSNGHGHGNRQSHFDNNYAYTGGALWIGSERFVLSTKPGALDRLARKLRNRGYRVKRYGNEFRISDHHRLGRVRFTNGKFRSVVVDRQHRSVTIRFYQIQRNRDDKPQRGHHDYHDRWDRRESPSISWRIENSRSRDAFVICW